MFTDDSWWLSSADKGTRLTEQILTTANDSYSYSRFLLRRYGVPAIGIFLAQVMMMDRFRLWLSFGFSTVAQVRLNRARFQLAAWVISWLCGSLDAIFWRNKDTFNAWVRTTTVNYWSEWRHIVSGVLKTDRLLVRSESRLMLVDRTEVIDGYDLLPCLITELWKSERSSPIR